MDNANPTNVIYVCPGYATDETSWLNGRPSYVCSFEDLTKRDNWLTINAMLGAGSALVMDRVSRYPKITSKNFIHMQQLSKRVDNKFLVDIVPFTLGIEYVYTPFSCLDRTVLGYAHWYAFRECYDELDDTGAIVSSHDAKVVAKKLASVTTCNHASLLAKRSTTRISCTDDELSAYSSKKEHCFVTTTNPTNIVTQLADLTHSFATRVDCAVELSQQFDNPLLLHNLASYATRLGKKLGKGSADSYALAVHRKDLNEFDAVVYVESPIAKAYLAFDIEARMSRTAQAVSVLSDAKVDAFLHNRAQNEISQITAVTEALIHGEKAIHKHAC